MQVLRVEFLLKTDSGYPKDTGVTLFSMATSGNPLRYDTFFSFFLFGVANTQLNHWTQWLLNTRLIVSIKTQEIVTDGCRESTGTRPDYLVNRANKKIEGPLGKKIAQKSRNRRRVSGRGVGAEGIVTKGANWRKPESWKQIQTLKDCLYCQIYCARLGPP